MVRKKSSKHFLKSIACLINLIGFHCLTPVQAQALPPRFSADAYASDFTVGQADLMLPLAGDRYHNFYLDPALGYGTDNQGYADLGLGYRWIKNNAAILGMYLFGSATRNDNNVHLWVANPGVEILGSRWDASLNGYIVMGNRNQTISTNLGSPYFTGHSEFINFYQIEQHTGSGADVKLAYQLFSQSSLKGYVGSYFFAPPQTINIWGGAAGLEYWPDQFLKVFANFTYDALHHSTGALGIGIEFGGTHVQRINPTVEERITDPVQRYLSELGRGSAIPSRSTLSASPQLLLNDIAFFSQTGSPNDGGTELNINNCTFENPCGPSDFSQTGVNTLSALLPNTLMYFNGGNYPALGSGGTGAIVLKVGQSVSSRTANYSQLASGAGRSIFNGAFILNNANTLSNIIILPIAASHALNAVTINQSTNTVIVGSQLGSAASPFNTGVLVSVSQTVMDNDEIFSTTRGLSIGGAKGQSQLTLLNSIINTNGATATAIILGTDVSNINISNSYLNGTASTTRVVDGIIATNGSVGSGSATVEVNNIEINLNNTIGPSYGLHTLGEGVIQIRTGELFIKGNNRSKISVVDGGSIQIANGTCTLNGVGGCP